MSSVICEMLPHPPSSNASHHSLGLDLDEAYQQLESESKFLASLGMGNDDDDYNLCADDELGDMEGTEFTETCNTTSETAYNLYTGPLSRFNKEEKKDFTLYFIRHGEAYHNVLEKEARNSAREEAISEGHDPDSEVVLNRMEEARKSVLNDNSLFDAPLSDKGQEEAKAACDRMKALIEEHSLPPPTEVLVSPLQRTLQTADKIFPDHMNIKVHEELRERCTGKPPDNRAPVSKLRRRRTFERFSMAFLRDTVEFDDITFQQEQCCAYCNSNSSDTDDDHPLQRKIREENKPMLRKRTKKLFKLLAESNHRSIAIVTHKGYLRELERGPFKQTAAMEFKNCEVRVYKATITHDNKLEAADRIV